jgi:predicted enzyme related to lactoylglutathione lyase
MRWIEAVALVGLLATAAARAADDMACDALLSADFSRLPDAPSQIVTAQVVPAQDITPRHCRVSAVVAPHIGVDIHIPLRDWNGKILQEGCGGSCGQSFIAQAEDALARGYAVTATDQGHRGSLSDLKWAYNDVTAELNAAYRATHLAQVLAEAVVAAVHGKAPRLAYFRGGSNGGRQALRSAQVFPGQFDGIIAGCAPPGDDATLNGLWGMRVNADAQRQPILTADILPRIYNAAVAMCDGDDGVTDGIIGDPENCGFRPEQLACSVGAAEPCLSGTQIKVLQSIYDGPRNQGGQKLVIDGPGIGSELNWRSFVPSAAGDLASRRRERRTDTLRYSSFIRDPGPQFQFEDFDWERDPPRMRGTAPISSATNPDLRPFKAAGAKMIMYIGTQDYIPTATLTDYYDTVERVLGGRAATRDTVRLFVIPGMDHCIGGPGAGLIDYLSYLEAWVERGEAPDRMLGISPTDWTAAFGEGIPKSTIKRERLYRDPEALAAVTRFSRPHFPYPARYVYDGSGDTNQAENFQALEPEDLTGITAEGVQGIGWYVLRVAEAASLVEFYRDGLGLGDLRSRDVLGMLWAGGPTVFEPNTGGRGEVYEAVRAAPFVPVFRSRDLEATFARLERVTGLKRRDAVQVAGDIRYYRDPAGHFFGLMPLTGPLGPDRVDPDTGARPIIKMQAPMREDLYDLHLLQMHTANPHQVVAWYRDVVGLKVLADRGAAGADLSLGDASILQIRPGGTPRTVPADRQQETTVPVFRVYGLAALMARLEAAGSTTVQVFDQTGGRIWYGADPDGTLVGFQERRMPSDDMSKWTTRLPEDLMARKMWRRRMQ